MHGGATLEVREDVQHVGLKLQLHAAIGLGVEERDVMRLGELDERGGQGAAGAAENGPWRGVEEELLGDGGIMLMLAADEDVAAQVCGGGGGGAQELLGGPAGIAHPEDAPGAEGEQEDHGAVVTTRLLHGGRRVEDAYGDLERGIDGQGKQLIDAERVQQRCLRGGGELAQGSALEVLRAGLLRAAIERRGTEGGGDLGRGADMAGVIVAEEDAVQAVDAAGIKIRAQDAAEAGLIAGVEQPVSGVAAAVDAQMVGGTAEGQVQHAPGGRGVGG